MKYAGQLAFGLGWSAAGVLVLRDFKGQTTKIMREYERVRKLPPNSQGSAKPLGGVLLVIGLLLIITAVASLI